MKFKTFVLIGSVALALVANAWTKNCALLVVGTSSRDTARVLKYEVHPEGWSYEGVFLESFDGHCRVPTAVAVSGDKVYVADWCGYCASTADAANKPAARLLQYDLDGNFVKTLNDDVRTLYSGKVCRLDSLLVSHDGKSLFATMGFYYSNAHAMKFSAETGARIWSIPGLSTTIMPCLTADDSTLIIPQRDTRYNPAVYDITKTEPVKIEDRFDAKNTVGAFLDEDKDELYVGGYQTKTKVFKFSTGELLREICGAYDTMYSMVKVDGTIYCTVGYDKGPVRPLNADGTAYAGTSVSENLYKMTEIPGANTGMVTIPFQIVPYTVTRDDAAVEIARWKFDEAANTAEFRNAVDASKFPIRARAVQSGATGVDGGALYFGGSTSGTLAHGLIEGSSKLLGASWGVFCWIGNNAGKFTSSTYILSTRLGGNNVGRTCLGIGAKGPEIFNAALVTINHSGPEQLINDGKWHHVGFVKNANTLSVWVDGVKRATTSDANVWSFVHETEIDYTLGMSAEEYSGNLPAGTFLDDLRVFDGAPADADIVAMYDQFKSAAGDLPSAGPAAPTYDTSVAGKYGTIVAHSFAHVAALTAPDILTRETDIAGNWYLTYSTDKSVTSLEAASQCFVSSNGGTSWALQSKKLRETDVSLYASGGSVAAFGRTVSVSGSSMTEIAPVQMYVNPTNGCALRTGYGSGSVADGSRLGNYVNDVNRISFRKYTEEPDLVTWQGVTPGSAIISDGVLRQAYFMDGRIGVVSATIGAGGALSDFSATAAENPPVETTFAGPLVPDGQGGWTPYFVKYGETSNLPGTDRPFNIRYDARTTCYWAAVTPDGKSVDLYASEDLADWKFAVTAVSIENAEATVANPSFDFGANGRDLILVYNLTAPDGGAMPRNDEEPNFVLQKVVSDYRRYSPFKKGMILIFR